MIKSAARRLDSAQGFADAPGCLRRPRILAREVSLLGPLSASRRSARRGRAFLAAAVVLLLMPVSGAFGAGATLTVQDAAAPPDGCSLTVPVVLSAPAGCAVAALQFDIEFDPTVMTLASSGAVLEGAAAKEAGKQITFSKASPDRIRVLVFGLNAKTIAGGEIAKLNFIMAEGRAVSAVSSVHVKNAVLADPNGSEVPVQTGGRAVQAVPPSRPETTADALRTFPLAPVLLVLGFLTVGGLVAGFVWRMCGRVGRVSRNCRKKSAARCAAGRHG